MNFSSTVTSDPQISELVDSIKTLSLSAKFIFTPGITKLTELDAAILIASVRHIEKVIAELEVNK